jgi:hypothetical protein
MATRLLTITPCSGDSITVSWAALLLNDDGQPFEAASFADYSVQAIGTFVGTLTFEGSNNGTNWHTLNDAQAVAFSITGNALEQIAEVARYIRPKMTGGDGTTTVVVTMYARRARR